MLLYYMFWMFMGFISHIIIIFRTNLLTRGPARIAVFFAYFSVSKKRNIKRSPNGMKPSGAIFLEQTQSRRLGVDVKKQPRWPRGRRARPRGRPLPSWAPHGFLDGGSRSPGSYLMRKSRFRRFHSVRTPFDILFLRNTEIGKKNSNSSWAFG